MHFFRLRFAPFEKFSIRTLYIRAPFCNGTGLSIPDLTTIVFKVPEVGGQGHQFQDMVMVQGYPKQ